MMLFIKYMSDLWKDKREQYENRYQGDAQRVERALARERFVLPPRPTLTTSMPTGGSPTSGN